MGHARAIVALAGGERSAPARARRRVARPVGARDRSAGQERARRQARRAKPQPVKPKKDVHTRAAEEQLRLSLGTPVEIKRKGKGGTIAIAFTNETELQRLYEYLTEKK